MFGQSISERIGSLTTGAGVLWYCDVNGTIILINDLISFDRLTTTLSLTYILFRYYGNPSKLHKRLNFA